MNGVTTAPSSGSLNKGGGPVRPPAWINCTDEVKIERMRQQIKNLQSTSYRTQNFLGRLRDLIASHKHLDGKVVEEVHVYDGSNSLVGEDKISSNPEDVYF